MIGKTHWILSGQFLCASRHTLDNCHIDNCGEHFATMSTFKLPCGDGLCRELARRPDSHLDMIAPQHATSRICRDTS